MTKLAIGIIGILFSGCGMWDCPQPPNLTKVGYDANYIAGYNDGWPSGWAAGSYLYCCFKKDTHRYENDSQYKQGYDDGFTMGKGKSEAVDRVARSAYFGK